VRRYFVIALVLLLVGWVYFSFSRKSTSLLPTNRPGLAGVTPSELSVTISKGSIPNIPFVLPSGALVGPVSAYARPVDITFDSTGNLYVSDDKSGNIFIIQKQ
jgi:hypothetical protein